MMGLTGVRKRRPREDWARKKIMGRTWVRRRRRLRGDWMIWEEDHETDMGAKKKTKRRLDEGGRRSWDGHGCEEEED